MFFYGSIADYEPDVSALRCQLAGRVAKLLAFEACQLRLLLVESDDLALMNDALATELIAFAVDHAVPEGIDQVWFADPSVASDLMFVELTDRIGRG